LNVNTEKLGMILKWGFIIFNWIYMILFTLLEIWPLWWVIFVLYPSFLF